MKNNTPLVALGLGMALMLSSGCAPTQKSTRGFVFPEGDVARGQAAFVALKCYECHQVHEMNDLPKPDLPAGKVIVLGGEVRTTKTYGDLLTAIIHPSQAVTARAADHSRSNETMPTVNEVMTVQQMVDLVTFLAPRYEKLDPLYHDPFMP
jgi:hypothetical protein